MSAEYHETGLSEEARDLHRAIKSLIEELEAIDWYYQRIDVSKDPSLQAVLAHNRDEEMEHAAMILEWLRRRVPHLDSVLKEYLFTTVPLHEIHAAEKASGGKVAAPAADLGIGRMKQ